MRLLDTLAKEVWRSRLLRALLLVSVIGSLTPSLASQSHKPSSTASGQPTAALTNSTSHYLKVTINPSTANIVEGAVYGLDAELENISNLPVTMELDHVMLDVQPELAPPEVSCGWEYPAGYNEKVPNPIVMQPGDHFTVFFQTGSAAGPDALKDSPQCGATYWGRLRRRLDFVPGNYAFVLTGTFSIPTPTLSGPTPNISATASGTTPEPSTEMEEHYFSEMASLPVTIDESQIIVYAGLGGLMAFLVVIFRNADTLSEYAGKVQATSINPHSKPVIILRQVAAAVLVSVSVTVIASRLSTTSFPVRVSVEDFWGAFTVGFVSYFIGGKFIDKLSETLTPGSKSGPAAPVPASPAAPFPAPAASVRANLSGPSPD